MVAGTDTNWFSQSGMVYCGHSGSSQPSKLPQSLERLEAQDMMAAMIQVSRECVGRAEAQ